MVITKELVTGAAISGALNSLATLRLEIFREYPYLYDGRLEDELEYLKSYAEAPDACVILAHDEGTVAGAATGMPFIHEGAQMLDAIAGSQYSVENLYYVGELLFYPAYRNKGLGLQLLGHMEQHIRSLGRYRQLVCATVDRTEAHPLKPDGYLPIKRFLARTGFDLMPGVTTSFSWIETDGVRRDHPMQFWVKELN
jgi:GNAT superfamily N-acetyltransferase